MKKIVTLCTLVLALAITFTACGGLAKSTDHTAGDTTTQPTAAPAQSTDTTAPSVLSVTPGGAVRAVNGNLVITFSEGINTASAGMVQLNNLAALSGGTWSAGNIVFTIPYSGLASGTTYTVNISGFKDKADNTMTDDKSHSFTVTAANTPSGGGINVNSEASWIAAINAVKNGGGNKTYTINVTNSFEITGITDTTPYFPATFGRIQNITVTINGATGSEIISVKAGTKHCIFKIDAYQNVIINNINLKGHSGNDNSLVELDDTKAVFTMKGTASISGNNAGSDWGSGIASKGTLIMQDSASIHDNTNINGGGGVCVSNGTFTMKDSASVYNNTTKHDGGGVWVYGGTFIMQNSASVYGNKSTYNGNGGGGVAVTDGTFIMEGGLIKGNTTGNNGGGIYVYPGNGKTATFRIVGGAAYGSSADASLKNTAATSGAALYVGGSGTATAQCGTFSGDVWSSSGTLATDNKTITVIKGVKQP